MSFFDESKVITSLHLEKAEVGKKYWYSDTLLELKKEVENNSTDIGELASFVEHSTDYPFHLIENGRCGDNTWQFLYPYEEPPKERMTNRQLSEWLAKGKGECKYLDDIYTYWTYPSGSEHTTISSNPQIRTWDSDEWIVPTIDIYERDCKKE